MDDDELQAIYGLEERLQPLNGFDLEDRQRTRELAREYLTIAGWQFRYNANQDCLIRMLLEQCIRLTKLAWALYYERESEEDDALED